MNIVNSIFLGALFVALISCKEKPDNFIKKSDGKDAIRESKYTTQELENELSKIIYPNKTIYDVNYDQAVSYALQRGAELHPNAPFLVPFVASPNLPSSKKFTIKCDGLSFSQLMDHICNQAELTWKIDNGVVVVEAPPHPKTNQ